jgi:hypothetical protein
MDTYSIIGLCLVMIISILYQNRVFDFFLNQEP